jgi:hypothetical protein
MVAQAGPWNELDQAIQDQYQSRLSKIEEVYGSV